MTLSTTLAAWGYPALFSLLLLTGVGSPVPEDALLVLAGYLVESGGFSAPLTLVVCVAGVVASDLMLYWAGRHAAARSSRWPDAHVLAPARLQRVTRWFDRVDDRVIFFARLVPGTRVLVFVTAGLRAVPVQTFLWYDTLGAFLWVPAAMAAGHLASRRLGGINRVVEALQGETAWALAAAVLALVLGLVRRRAQPST